ncbi:MAG TPA: hypothetical protein VFV64_02775 [Permianibacter sp.]|nr:hypothetical protein [Permianibacter sp.]
MRWIVISLLVVNALILGWRWFAANEPVPAPRTPVVSAPAIELLPDGAVSPVLPAESAPLTTEGDAAATEASVPHSEPTGEALGDIGAESILTTDAVVAQTDPNLAGSASPVVSVGADVPASETPSLSRTGDASAPALTTGNTPAQTSAQCAWTPWRERPVTDLGAAELLQTEQEEQEIGRSYLVYVPAKASRELTLQRLAELKAEGIEAAYLNKGPQAGGISLGLFSKPESMQLRLRELKKAGIVDVSGIERIRTEPRIRQLLRWTGEKTPSPVQNQALVSCNDIAPAAAGQ